MASQAATPRSERTASTRTRGLSTAVIVATALGFFLVQLDVSIVNVALATIGRDLHSSFAALQWVVDAYAVAFAACLLSAGAIADRIGARRAFITGLVLFGCSSIACGFAPTAAILVTARAIQGIGAALLVPCSLALLNHAAEGDAGECARGVSLWTAAGSIALAAGPIIGGVLVAGVGWRSIFYVNVPLVAVGIWLTLHSVNETRPQKSSLDVPGQLSAIAMLGTLTAAVITAGSIGWGAPLVLILFAVAVASAIVFVLLESRGPDVMLPLDLFRRPPFTVATIRRLHRELHAVRRAVRTRTLSATPPRLYSAANRSCVLALLHCDRHGQPHRRPLNANTGRAFSHGARTDHCNGRLCRARAA
jgi:MFS transporter, DHA2 family, methylenomycin A resistance protein